MLSLFAQLKNSAETKFVNSLQKPVAHRSVISRHIYIVCRILLGKTERILSHFVHKFKSIAYWNFFSTHKNHQNWMQAKKQINAK
jgi:hypothetical protein